MVSVGDVLREAGTLPKAINLGGQVAVMFTVYTLPNGARTTAYLMVNGKYEDTVRQVFDAGYVFEIEKLTNGMYSMTITHPECDLACRLSPDADGVASKVEEMIAAFDFDAALTVIAAYRGDGDDDIDDAMNGALDDIDEQEQ